MSFFNLIFKEMNQNIGTMIGWCLSSEDLKGSGQVLKGPFWTKAQPRGDKGKASSSELMPSHSKKKNERPV